MSKKDPQELPYKAILKQVIGSTLKQLKADGKLSLEEVPEFSCYPSQKVKGEWLTDVACKLGRPEGKGKDVIAQMIINALPWLQEDSEVACPFSDFDTYPPGFICFRI